MLGPDDILWIYIGLASLKFAFPDAFLVYQVWAFIRPALPRANEARAVSPISATFICFVLGLAFGFCSATPAILQVLLSLGEGGSLRLD